MAHSTVQQCSAVPYVPYPRLLFPFFSPGHRRRQQAIEGRPSWRGEHSRVERENRHVRPSPHGVSAIYTICYSILLYATIRTLFII